MNKKIAISLAIGLFAAGAVLAQTNSPTPTPTASPTVSPSPSVTPHGRGDKDKKENHKANVDLACMQSAVDKRDTSVEAAVDHYAATVKTALETRKTALKAAWAITDASARHQAINDAWNAYKKSVKTARRVFKNDRNAAWQQFRTDAKACHGNSSEDGGGEGADAQL